MGGVRAMAHLRTACLCALLVVASATDLEQEERVELSESHRESYDPLKTDWGEGFDDMSSVLDKYDKPLSFKSKQKSVEPPPESVTEKLLAPPEPTESDAD